METQPTVQTPLAESYTSTGIKLFHHQEAMTALRNGRGIPITAWIAGTDVCNAKCTFCSVGERAGDVLPFSEIKDFVDQLAARGLKGVIFSGGGNFLLYKDGKHDCNSVIEYVHSLGIECALITNGMPMARYEDGRTSWKTMKPSTLDKLTWVRISMAGLDHNHKEQQVFVPDIDHSKTTLGFSWIMADSYEEPSHKHGWVSSPEDIRTPMENRKVVLATDRLGWIEEQIAKYVKDYNPAYVRLLCNCIQPELIPQRHAMLTAMADRIDPSKLFSQSKPPRQPKPCRKVYPHPCLNADGWVYPCDSVVLNKTANHQFGSAWRICRGKDIGALYDQPIRDVIQSDICPGCVFATQTDMLYDITQGMETPLPAGPPPAHLNFV